MAIELTWLGHGTWLIEASGKCRHCGMFAVLKNETSGAIDLLNHEVNVCPP